MNRIFPQGFKLFNKPFASGLLCFVAMLVVTFSFSRSAAQGTVIGTFPQLDGGFESGTAPTTQATAPTATPVGSRILPAKLGCAAYK